MSYPLPKCDHAFCDGHLGKFDSCRDEALYQLSLDGGDESTGDSDFEGHFILMEFATDETHTDDDIALGEPVIIPAGTYILQSHTSGKVSVARYDTTDEARVVYDEVDDRYGRWSESQETP